MIVRFFTMLFLLCGIVFAAEIGAGLAMFLVLWIIDKIKKS